MLALVGPKVLWIKNCAAACSSGAAEVKEVVVVVVRHCE